MAALGSALDPVNRVTSATASWSFVSVPLLWTPQRTTSKLLCTTDARRRPAEHRRLARHMAGHPRFAFCLG
ncbi:uncharacterized protein SPSK_06822 [Sporothrix schenckii 1099-18]|uniref:Uncharacterized protein n=1 Tax=Sporothrix schenckii 1099-18 TaxID=1397361 RepID=A0A0F2MME0_SPOSC|nr:uncharacterized protein SPSK_06822 [Sporothrix schenckii 1099-18]KJR89990.1 hypothetical protein SPSK_06822 [Sporothrix schenckii 1099-18]